MNDATDLDSLSARHPRAEPRGALPPPPYSTVDDLLLPTIQLSPPQASSSSSSLSFSASSSSRFIPREERPLPSPPISPTLIDSFASSTSLSSFPTIGDALAVISQPANLRSPSTSRNPSAENLLNHHGSSSSPYTVTIPSNGDSLASGFSRASPTEMLSSHHTDSSDWHTFIDHVNQDISRYSQLSPETYVNHTRGVLSQWSESFFEPRGLQISLRRCVVPITPTRGRSFDGNLRNPASPSSPPLSPRIAASKSAENLSTKTGEPEGGWTSPHAAAANAAYLKVQKKLDAERAKYELKLQASMKKANKEKEKREKAELKERKAKEKQEKKKSTGKEAKEMVEAMDKWRTKMPNGRHSSIGDDDDANGTGDWELVLQCIA